MLSALSHKKFVPRVKMTCEHPILRGIMLQEKELLRVYGENKLKPLLL